MTIVAEVRDALKAVNDVVGYTRTMIDAVNDGQKYLKARQPQAGKDLAKLLAEVSKTVSGLAEVSGVVTHFQFTVAGSGRDLEPRRFNNYVIASKKRVQALQRQQRALRGRSSKVEEHARKLDDQAGGPWAWPSLLKVKGRRRQTELAAKMHGIYGTDLEIIKISQQMLRAVDTTLKEVSTALGPGATARPRNVPAAARLLTEYGDAFAAVELELIDLEGELAGQIEALT